MTSGRCRFCRCSHFDACPQGCGWADGAATLCTECVPIARAWNRLAVARKPNMVRAFFRGFTAGSCDVERADASTLVLVRTGELVDVCPYGPGQSARYWALGHQAGRALLRMGLAA